MLTRIVTSLDQVKGVKIRAAEKTGRATATEEIEEEEEVWKLYRKHSTKHKSIQREKKRSTSPQNTRQMRASLII